MMVLAQIYQEFKMVSKAYLGFVQQLVDNDFAMIDPESVREELASGKEKFEQLMEKAAALEVEDTQSEDMGDLRYLLMDHVFLAGDLAHFYQLNEVGRFKMRALNALNKNRRSEMM